MNLLLLANIASAFATLAKNPAMGKKSDEVSAVAGLVGLAFQVTGMVDTERRLLLAQVENANLRGSGLTDLEMADWHDRHARAKAAIEGWHDTRLGPEVHNLKEPD